MIPWDSRTVTGEEIYLVTAESEWQTNSRVFRLVCSILIPTDDPAAKYISGRLGSKEELSAAELNAIHTWLKAEGIDGRGASLPELPRRVIEVSAGDSTPCCLYQSQEGERAEYVALSYCWGPGAQQLTTMSSNITDHLAALPSGLGRTILDAIHVCRKIGMRFLWVDALCIIQDDDDDKLDQIAGMGSIYRCSTLTIVAACAEKVTDGFLTTNVVDSEAYTSMPRPRSPPELKLPVFINKSTLGTTYLRFSDLDTTYAPEEPLFKGARLFKKLMLSPRALIFDSRHITLKSPGVAFKPLWRRTSRLRQNALNCLPLCSTG